jgi:hypothetical protein
MRTIREGADFVGDLWCAEERKCAQGEVNSRLKAGAAGTASSSNRFKESAHCTHRRFRFYED